MIEAKINFINICNGVFTIIADFCNFNKNMNTAIFVGQKNLMLEFRMALSNPNTHSSLKLQLLISFKFWEDAQYSTKNMNRKVSPN